MAHPRLVAGAFAVTALAFVALAATTIHPSSGGTTADAARDPVLVLTRAPALVTRMAGDVRLETALDGVLANAPTTRDRVCLVVHDTGGRPVYAYQPATPLVPASNLKLLTATVAVDQIGASTKFTTEVRAAQPVTNGVIAGDLWFVGAGDPLLATTDYAAQAGYQHQPRPATSLESLADRVVAAGVRQVQGRLVGDDSRYDNERYLPTWPPQYAAMGQIGPMSALNVNDGFTAWSPRPVPATSPATAAATTLAGLLKARGVTIAGGPGEGRAPAGTRTVASIESMPLSGVVAEMLTQSDNQTAELLLKELGAHRSGTGTTAAGLQVVHDRLAALGYPADQLHFTDGSGLDRSDRATCGALLETLDREGGGGAIAAGLSTAGRDGTLAKRFGSTPAAGRVRGKTGSLEGVTALTGFVDGANRTLSFSLLANGGFGDDAGKALQDRLVTALVGQ